MQDLEELKSKVSILDYILKENPASKVKRSGITTQISPCPFCNKGIKTPHFSVYEGSNSFSSFGCELNGIKGGTIIDYIKAKENLDDRGAINRLYEITGTPAKDYTPTLKKEKGQEIDTKKLEEINTFCASEFSKMQEKEREKLKKYLETRKISEDAISKYKMFLSKNLVKGKEFVVIPIIENGKAKAYVGRNINKEDAFRYKNSIGNMDLFNKQYLKQEAMQENELIFICEGIFDAISIEEQGLKAISLNSTSNTKKLIEAIKENLETAKNYKYIIATDTDESGEKAKEELQKELTKLNLVNTFIDIPLNFFDNKQYKDVNEWLKNSDKETFREKLEDSIYNKFNNETLLFYMDDYFRELKNYNKQPLRSTGFRLLDEQLNGRNKTGALCIGRNTKLAEKQHLLYK